VWKATTEVGCAVAECADGTIFSNMGGQKSSYVVCECDLCLRCRVCLGQARGGIATADAIGEYRRPGNMVGNNNQYFRDNVGRRQG
jgi:hypothetical protein